MANPFLFEDVADYGDTTSASSNPFLCGGDEPVSDNPFLASVSSAPGTNPFADYSWDEPTGNDGLLTPPPITNINDPENDFIASSDDEAIKPRRPIPPRPSMPKETQDLILSVTGALKATSDHLLDRLPPTRAPSPTTFADLHSPSPTPDLLGGEVDFLALTQQPARPPPPRPPARPAPPPVPAPPQITQPQQPVQSDMFDLFGTPSAPQPKSNNAILNLYSQPKPPPTDLLNDDNSPNLQAPLMSSEPTLQSSELIHPTEFPEVKPVSPKEVSKALPPDPLVDENKVEEQPYIFGTRPPPPTVLTNVKDSEPLFDEKNQTIDEVPPSQTQSFFDLPEEPAQSNSETSEPTHGIFGTAPELHEEEGGGALLSNESLTKNDASQIFGTDHLAEESPQIFGVGPPTVEQPSQIFGVGPAEVEPPSQIFGVGPAEVEPPSQIFGVGPAERESPSQIFGVGPSKVESPSQIFGVEPAAVEPPSQTFGVDPPAVESHSQLFGVEPPVVEPHSQIFGVGPPAVTPPSQLFGKAPPPVAPRPKPFEVSLPSEPTNQLFGGAPQSIESTPTIFGVGPPVLESDPLESFVSQPAKPVDAFDAFSAAFDSTDAHKGQHDSFDPFGGSSGFGTHDVTADAWGGDVIGGSMDQGGFGGDSSFDAFLSMSQPPPVPQPTPSRLDRAESADSEEGGFNIFIKPREGEVYPQSVIEAPALAPPPKSPAYADNDPRFNPFDKNGQIPAFPLQEGFQLPALSQTEPYEGGFKRTDSQETPPTPLFDEDVSQPLEEFPRIHYSGDGWEMQLRQPNKKKITGQRFWKKIFMKLVYQGDNPVLQLFNLKEDKDPFQELPLQACYSVSEICAQQYDQFGKIFTVKLQYIFYKERPGVRPGQVTKAERITNKLSQFAAYAIQGDYQGVKEFGSDLKKLGLPVEHAPQISQLLKIGCMSYDDLKQFSVTIEECLFRMPVHRDRALTYKMEEVQMTVVDEMFVEQDAFGHVEKQIARVRVFFLAFLSGMPDVELGMNDMWRQGKEVVGRHDIIPVVTEEWIRLESVEFHSCVQLDEYEKTRTIKFKPPDACYIELMRFRIRPPKNRELPLQLKAVMCVTGNKVELRADVLVPGFTSRKLGQIPCEDVMIRFPIPECWIYLFRVEKHFRYGSVKSAHRRTGKIKGIERFLGAVENMEPSLMEVTSGQAKYEHQHRAIVWRMPRLPKEGQGAYTTHNLVCRMQLTSYDQIPDNLADYAYVEFTMPATTASHTTVRSVSLVDSDSDNPPEKYVRQLARLEYRVGIEHTQGEEMASYVAATVTKPKPPPEVAAPTPPQAPDSDSDSSG